MSKDYDKFLIFTLVAFSISLAGLVVVHILSSNAAYAQQQISTVHSIQNNTNFNTLFKSVNLNEFEIQPPPIPLAKESLAAASADNRSAPIIVGEQQVNTNIGIVFSIR